LLAAACGCVPSSPPLSFSMALAAAPYIRRRSLYEFGALLLDGVAFFCLALVCLVWFACFLLLWLQDLFLHQHFLTTLSSTIF
jgi:hypothetical protein